MATNVKNFLLNPYTTNAAIKPTNMTINNILIELEKKGIRNDELQADRNRKYLNITRDTGEFFAVLIRAVRAQNILEVGTSNGYSTLWLASSLPENGTVTTIELSENKAKEALLNIERARLSSKIILWQGNALEKLRELRGEYDFIFLDADRSQYMEMTEDILRLLKTGGLLVCDNAVSHPEELADFMASLKSRPRLSTSLVPVGKGQFLVYKG